MTCQQKSKMCFPEEKKRLRQAYWPQKAYQQIQDVFFQKKKTPAASLQCWPQQTNILGFGEGIGYWGGGWGRPVRRLITPPWIIVRCRVPKQD